LFVYTWDRSRVAFVPCFVGRPLPCTYFRAVWEKETPPPPQSLQPPVLNRGGSSAQWRPGLPRFVFSNQSYAHVFRHARFSRVRARQASTATCYCTIAHNCCTFHCSRRVELLRRASIPFVIFCVHGKI
jgi:hypothetical protein